MRFGIKKLLTTAIFENRPYDQLRSMVLGKTELTQAKLAKILKDLYDDVSLQCSEHGCYFIQDDIEGIPIYSMPIGSLEHVASQVYRRQREYKKQSLRTAASLQSL